MFALCGGIARAQNAGGETKVLTLFEGKAIEQLDIKGQFDVEIRQGTTPGFTIEVPAEVVVDTSWHPDGWEIRSENPSQPNRTLYCHLDAGRLRLDNHCKVLEKQERGSRMWYATDFCGHLIVTVPKLNALRFTMRKGGSLNVDDHLPVTSMELKVWGTSTNISGAKLKATESISVEVFNSSQFAAEICNTPNVRIKVFNKGSGQLKVDSVAQLQAEAFNSGTLDLNVANCSVANVKVFNKGQISVSGQIGALTQKAFQNGVLDISNLQVDKLINEQQVVVAGKVQAGNLSIVSSGGSFSFGKEPRVIQAADGCVYIYEVDQTTQGLPKAGDQQKITMDIGTSVIITGGGYQVTQQDGKIILTRLK